MKKQEKSITINEEDAFSFIVQCLREGNYSSYGYDLYLPIVMRKYLISVFEVNDRETDRYLEKISPSFYAAAWELCRKGILRPGIAAKGLQSTDNGSAGNGYSVLPFGQEWLQKAEQYDYVPLEPGRIARILDSFGPKFGPGFRERAQEAIRCYRTPAYLACCVMCGAAAESIILSLAIAKTKDEDRILKDIEAKGGRTRIENLIIGQKSPNIQNEFRSYSSLLKYWRDIAGHGKKSNITDKEAFTAQDRLLRLALFANERWDDLIKS